MKILEYNNKVIKDMNEEKSRLKNSAINVFFGILSQATVIILNFITRTVFIKTLGEEYLGINGLFTNILSMLSLADLGFDVAVVYSMYKPIAEKDNRKLATLMNFYKKIYVIIAIFIAVIGIIIIPFLDDIINLENKIDHIILYYLLYLINTIVTYLLANRVAIINADQKMYIIKRYTTIFKVIQAILQIIVLIVKKSFLLYLLVQILCNLLINLYGAYKAKKMYPFINDKESKITKEEQKSIFSNVKSMFVYKIGSVVLNNTDSIIISKYINTVMVGFYSNYLTIISAINTFLTIVFTSITASLGNLNVSATGEKKADILYKLDFIANWSYGFCSVCIFTLCGHFIGLIWGTKYILSNIVLIAITINFYIVGNSQPIILYRNTTGMFKEAKYIFIWTSIINIVLSIALACILPTEELKLFGILIATPISRVLTNVWYEPYKLFTIFFNKKPNRYYFKKIKDFIIVMIIILITWNITNLFKELNVVNFIIKVIISIIIPNILYWLVYRKTNEFKFFKEILVKILIDKIRKNI